MKAENSNHEWNVLIVNEFEFPRKPAEEFQVFSKSALGAAMKASKRIKEDFPDWKIKSVWHMDPKRTRRER